MKWAWSLDMRGKKCIQNFGGEACGEVVTWLFLREIDCEDWG